jgi:transcriptional regulator with XRE-family HTH domain
MSELGKRIIKERLLLGMTQQELADAVGLTRDKITKIETGDREVSRDELLAFARLFEVTAEDLAAPVARVRNRLSGTKPATAEAIAWLERCVENSLFLDRLPALYAED